MVRTRFAPSPTGYLHIGGARTALFSWAFARKHGGKFILRIEDTDLERSTQESVQAILDGMAWLNLDYDEGPFYQMQRLKRYQEIAQYLIEQDKAYYCYASKEELDEMREAQRARGEKPRYDGRWRDSKMAPPSGVKPVVRLKSPLNGEVEFNDLVKGKIVIQNSELDDLVLLRTDGVPTYNFGVVIDDLDMNITHVIRGDDHVNNTPRQINILKALDAPLPQYAHVPMILGSDGERLSKRHGAVSVMQYKDEGFLPEALINYLARLGWGHGDEEIFSREQFVEWFDLTKISVSPARFNSEKLLWLNQEYLKTIDPLVIAQLLKPLLESYGCEIERGPEISRVVSLLKERVNTLQQMADAAIYFYKPIEPSEELKQKHFKAEIKPALEYLVNKFEFKTNWNKEEIHHSLSDVTTVQFPELSNKQLKLGQIAMPLRVMVTGSTQSPSIDATLELIGKEESIARMRKLLKEFPG